MIPSESGTSDWPSHVLRAGPHRFTCEEEPKPEEHREHVEPWLSALFQAEHLNLLVGSGLTTALAIVAEAPIVNMQPAPLKLEYAESVQKAAMESATRLGRGEPNIEDQIRAILDLIGGLRVLAKDTQPHGNGNSLTGEAREIVDRCESALDKLLTELLKQILETERGIVQALAGSDDTNRANRVRRLLGGFLLPFASRAGTRDRLHIFTTNYDRVIEYGCDLLGLYIVDRFVGSVAPVFHASRLGIDLHYNPPGIRGEPRYLEGVVRLTKLHGSVDWRWRHGPSGDMQVQRCALPFGAAENHPEIPEETAESVLIFPNPAKDVETLEYPYAELFRDFAAAVCRPNAVVVTYGYGFGDDHVNRILADMLTIPSTHLVILSWDRAGGRIQRFCERTGRDEQITLLVGNHFGDLETLIQYYLPKPAIDRTTWRMMDLLRRRVRPQDGNDENFGKLEDLDAEESG